ncbi:cupin domain-containing protein [Streptomyces sp. NPDC002403]
MTRSKPSPTVADLTQPTAVSRCTGISLQEFVQNYWGRVPRVAEASQLPGSFEDLLTIDAVDTLISTGGLRAPHLRIIQDGADVETRRFTKTASIGSERFDDVVDSDAVARFLDQGATLVGNTFQKLWAPLGVFSDRIANELGHRVNANLYITPASRRGLNAHYDTHDVFVLQLEGSKRWLVHEPVVQLPLPSQSHYDVAPATNQDPVLDVVLHAGDCLYLPRGYIHAPEAQGERSTHLTLAVLTVRWADIVRDVVAEAVAKDVELRASAPLDLISGRALMADQLVKKISAFATSLGNLEDLDSAAVVDRWAELTRVSEPVAVLGRSLTANSLDGITPLRPRMGVQFSLRPGPDGQGLILTGGDRRMRIPTEYENAVRYATTRPCTAQEIAADPENSNPTPDIIKMLKLLVSNGFLVPC